MPDVLVCPPDVLRDAARSIARVQRGMAHWSRVAMILGRVQDERLAKTFGYVSARAYATDGLHFSDEDYSTYERLWAMMRGAAPVVAYSEWGEISKAKALLIRRMWSLGAEASSWLARARSCSLVDLRTAVNVALGREPWVTMTIRVPGAVLLVIEQAMTRALPAALEEPAPAPERIHDPDVAFRCLEVICADYLAGRATVRP